LKAIGFDGPRRPRHRGSIRWVALHYEVNELPMFEQPDLRRVFSAAGWSNLNMRKPR
jgi:hypothetical protein